MCHTYTYIDTSIYSRVVGFFNKTKKNGLYVFFLLFICFFFNFFVKNIGFLFIKYLLLINCYIEC